ncbi:hypothetical protein V6N13_023143 [Hibiscus sabdariffa]|uniref:Uncharacterized protein n=2 Tax=Hibiscus sabdariffa TaxID=183260 RepID=A0ABR2ALN8_9ROSI
MSIKLACVVVVWLVVGAAVPLAQGAITCGEVTSSLAPCIPYLTSGGTLPPGCCSGIESLNAAAQTTPDRQAACNCLKTAAATTNGINYSLASGLPSNCGVSPTTDCNQRIWLSIY